jgi:hypothetical protein
MGKKNSSAEGRKRRRERPRRLPRELHKRLWRRLGQQSNWKLSSAASKARS